MRRIRVGVLFGGQSGEHAVSIASAASVLGALDRSRYEAVPIGITQRGEWLPVASPEALLGVDANNGAVATQSEEPGALIRTHGRYGVGPADVSVDVVFPVLHGPRGEDGTVQGLLELANIPYVGSGVLASAVSMDKSMMKAVFAAAGIPGVPYHTVELHRWQRNPAQCVEEIERRLSYPVFVKPCNMGSSVGISKARDAAELRRAVNAAFDHDRRAIVEQGVDAREIECGVLGNEDPLVSVPGEVVPHGEFYDYESKYTEGKSDLIIPAPLSETETQTIRQLAARAFEAVQASGLARVDFFILRESGQILVNELNTMPGFTATSMYPKLWEASGLSYGDLISRLIDLALARRGGDVNPADASR